jgi:hypothetical protein
VKIGKRQRRHPVNKNIADSLGAQQKSVEKTKDRGRENKVQDPEPRAAISY